MEYPKKLIPILALINSVTELGLSSWYEVIYFDGSFKSYSGSKTFEDGEKVIKWTYCSNVL